jgi:propionyl-CoA carboxylase alpha chain
VLDLVELMIRIAAGETLPIGQKDVRIQGWAVEARIYAEDPRRNFLPSTGRLTRFRPPPEDAGLRIDTGVYEGAEISIHYDPMIAKLIGSGRDRASAIAHALAGLDRFVIGGVRHNVDFLAALLGLKRFQTGAMSTNLIAEEFPHGFQGQAADRKALVVLASLAAALHHRAVERDGCISGQLAGRPYRNGGDWVVRIAGEVFPASVRPADGGTDVEIEGRTMTLRGDLTPGLLVFDGTVNGHPFAARVERDGIAYRLAHGGVEAEALVLTEIAARYAQMMPVKSAPDLSRFLLSPMPGLLVSVAVASGQEVKAGETLAVIEAMKMENVLKAERDGTIKQLMAKPGDSLAVDQKILEFA